MADPIDEPQRDLQDVADIESIQNLDTARMTLRWALERLRAVEKLNKELAAKADWEFRMRMKAEDDFKAQWDLEKAHHETVQRQREAELEKNFAGKLVEWERSYQEQAKRLEGELREQAEKAKRQAEDSKRKVEEEYGQKLVNLESLTKQRTREMDDKEREFDRFCELQKQHADNERRQIKGEAQREADERFKTVQKLMEERMASLGVTWQREKESLLKDLDAWRTRAEEAMTRSLELERTSRNAEDLARQATRLADEREAEYQRLSQAWERQRASMDEQVRHWQELARQQETKAEELEKGRHFTEEQAHQAVRIAEDRQAESLKMVEAWERQRASLDEQIRQWQKRATESDALANAARDEAAEAKRMAEKIDTVAALRHAEVEKRLAEREARIADRERQLADAVQSAVADYNTKRAEIERLKRDALERVGNRAAVNAKRKDS